MKAMTKRRVKIGLRVGVSVLLTCFVCLTVVGIYFAMKSNPKTKTHVNPLAFSFDVWDGSKDKTTFLSGNDFGNRGEKVFTINSASALAHFVDLTNDAEVAKEYDYFKDYTIYLNSNINLNGKSLNSIGKTVEVDGVKQSTFQGTFDGSYYSIMNGKIKGNGLFNYVSNATIKNIGLYNVKISGNGEYAGAIVGTAENSNISSVYSRLCEVKGKNVAGLVGKFVTTEKDCTIEYSFAHSSLKGDKNYGLVAKIEGENLLNVSNSYYANENSHKNSANLSLNNVKNISKNKSFNDFEGYTKEWTANDVWCDYTTVEGAEKFDFDFPILTKFNKVFMEGACYIGVVNQEDGTISNEDVSINNAVLNAENDESTEINIIVKQVFLKETIEVSGNKEIVINSDRQTKIVRDISNNDSMIKTGDSSKLILGDENSPKEFILDGNKDLIKANNLLSGAVIENNGQDIVLNGNVVIQNNINNTTKNGGGLSLDFTSSNVNTLMDLDGLKVLNCEAENGGGIYVRKTNSMQPLSSRLSVSYLDRIDEKTESNLILDDVDIVYCYATDFGGGIYYEVENGVVTLTNARIHANQAQYGGGAYVKLGKLLIPENSPTRFGGVDLDGDGTLEFGGFDENYYDQINHDNYARLDGGAIYIDTSAYLELNGGTFIYNVAERSGGAIYSLGNAVITHEVNITNCEAGYYYIYSQNRQQSEYDGCGGAIYFAGESLFIEGGTITNCEASTNGGAMYVTSDASVTIAKLTISNNNALSCGGGIYSDGVVEMRDTSLEGTDTLISSNHAINGGAVYNNAGLFILESGTISNNTAGSAGGAIYSLGTTNMNGGTISNNTAGENGGGIISNGTLNFAGGTISNNTATYHGGGIYSSSTSSFEMTYGDITLNNANEGGGLYISCSEFTISDGTISNNTASSVGGGLYVGSTSEVVGHIQNATIIDNRAGLDPSSQEIQYGSGIGKGGGIFQNGNTTLTLTSVTVNSNTASSYGGGIYVGANTISGICNIEGNTTISNNEATGYTYYQDSTYGYLDEYTQEGNGGGIYVDVHYYTVDNWETGWFDEYYVYGELNLTSATIDGNFADNGGGIYTMNSLTIADGVKLLNNTAENNGGAVFGLVDVTGGEISGNNAQNGAGLYGAFKSIDGGKFKGNHASVSGGAIYSTYFKYDDPFNVQNAEFSYNLAGTSGGAIYCGQLTVENSTIKNNYAGYTYSGTDRYLATNYTYNGEVNSYGGGVYSCDDGYIVIDSGEISYNSAKYGGGIYFEGATLTLNGGLLTENHAEADGGAIFLKENGGWARNSEMVMAGGTISHNTAVNGAGIYSTYKTTLNGGEISYNVAKTSGGGIYAIGNLTIDGEDMKLQHNYAGYLREEQEGGGYSYTIKYNSYGGAIYANTCILIFISGIIDDHKACSQGGAIYLIGSTLNMSGGTISNSYAPTTGAVYLVSSSTMNLSSGTISHNTSVYGGAGIWISSGCSLTMSGGSIEYNENTDGNSGAIQNNGTATLTGGSVSYNSATGSTGRGGAVYNASGAFLSSENVKYVGNYAGGGGAIYSLGTVELTGGEISGNKVKHNGGGVYLASGSSWTSSGVDILNCEASQGAGIYVKDNVDFNFRGKIVNESLAENVYDLYTLSVFEYWDGNYVPKIYLGANAYLKTGSADYINKNITVYKEGYTVAKGYDTSEVTESTSRIVYVTTEMEGVTESHISKVNLVYPTLDLGLSDYYKDDGTFKSIVIIDAFYLDAYDNVENGNLVKFDNETYAHSMYAKKNSGEHKITHTITGDTDFIGWGLKSIDVVSNGWTVNADKTLISCVQNNNTVFEYKIKDTVVQDGVTYYIIDSITNYTATKSLGHNIYAVWAPEIWNVSFTMENGEAGNISTLLAKYGDVIEVGTNTEVYENSKLYLSANILPSQDKYVQTAKVYYSYDEVDWIYYNGYGTTQENVVLAGLFNKPTTFALTRSTENNLYIKVVYTTGWKMSDADGEIKLGLNDIISTDRENYIVDESGNLILPTEGNLNVYVDTNKFSTSTSTLLGFSGNYNGSNIFITKDHTTDGFFKFVSEADGILTYSWDVSSEFDFTAVIKDMKTAHIDMTKLTELGATIMLKSEEGYEKVIDGTDYKLYFGKWEIIFLNYTPTFSDDEFEDIQFVFYAYEYGDGQKDAFAEPDKVVQTVERDLVNQKYYLILEDWFAEDIPVVDGDIVVTVPDEWGDIWNLLG
ncbi:MAG: hypothetical protein E7374_02195 [Clostridiales bacterium]|nr:hypothetical protein [Clostridiales bacterium]